MSTYQVSTKNLGVNGADTFIQSVADNAYYMFAARPGNYSTNNIPVAVDTTSSIIQEYDDLIFGKRISDTDVCVVANRYNWEINTVYDMYEDSIELSDKRYFVLVQEGELYKVYKCLFNNNGGPSLVEPFGTDVDILETPIDGYVWKYMYSFDLFDALRFMTDTHMPVIEDPTIKAAAVPGSIDVIKINYGGAGYSNYTAGSFKDATDLAINEDPTKYGLDGNASLIDNFYNGCIIKMTSGVAAGRYRTITDYEIIDGRRVITIDSPFEVRSDERLGVISKTDTYEIYPRVYFYEVNGDIKSECVARALVGGTSNTIIKIEVLNSGEGYRAGKARLMPDPSVGVNPDFVAELTPIIPPPGGHGSDVKTELSSTFVCVSTSFIGDESPLTARGTSDYSSIGILKNPLYANVRVYIDSDQTIGQFTNFEEVERMRQIKLSGNVSFNATNTYVYSTDTQIEKSLRIGDSVLIKSPEDIIRAKVNAVVDDSTFLIDITPPYEKANCELYLIQTENFATITNVDLNYLDLTNVKVASFDKSDCLIGTASDAIAVIDSTANSIVVINSREDSQFSGFNQLTKFYGEFKSDVVFELDEVIVQDPSNINSPRASVYNFENSPELNKDVIYASNVSSNFITTSEDGTGNITGLTSNAYFISQYKYSGDLISDSGEILYLENLNPINRSTTRSETIKLILRF